MTLLLFWIKILINRINNLFKSSPVIIIWAAVVIGAFIFAIANKYISISIDENTLFFIIPFLLLFPLISSFENNNLLPLLIRYSKSEYSNKIIYIKYFLKQAFIKNIFLIIFLIAAYYSLREKIYLFLFPVIIILSVTLSFLFMYYKNVYLNKKIKEVNTKKRHINPLIKSTLHEYLTPDFIVLALLSISLFIIILMEFSQNNLYLQMETQFFIYASIAISIGFLGVVESIYNIYWMYQTIIFSNDYKYHFKRTAIFLAGVFGLFILIFIISGGIVNLKIMLKYFLCICVIFTVTINIALSKSNIIFKIIIISINIILTIWISTLNFIFLLVLTFPVIISYIKAKNEYWEWTVL